MKKSSSVSSSMSDGSRELQCIGRLEITRPEPVGFLCGSIVVPTDKSFHSFNSAIVPSSQTVIAPRYQMIPTETDLNMPPHASDFSAKLLPVGTAPSMSSGDNDSPCQSETVTADFTRKGESLAVSGLAEYGDQVDVIAPTDILKQIFKIPYTKARLSIAVRRVGQTLVLNTGPDIEEGEKLVQRHNNLSKRADQSLFLNFAMHSVRMEACDCPPNHNPSSEEQTSSSVYPAHEERPQISSHPEVVARHGPEQHQKYSQSKKEKYLLGSRKNKTIKGRDSVQKDSQIGEKLRGPMQESEKYKRVCNDGFLRVLFWQFHNFRMLLGSDMLLFSNEKYLAVSLHLWDVNRQVTPLTWLEAWLDNVMASVPEMAICYHQNGVVQGYELLKTDDIFLLKGISDDGTPAFSPNVVQQNGLSVLRFLQKNCEQDPGAYWLYKSAGEDVIQLFDLSVIPNHTCSEDIDENLSALPSLIHTGRSDSTFSLGTLLYRIAHRLSLSLDRTNRAKCASFFKKCLDYLDESEHLVVRAFAHEQFARLILSCEEDLNLTSESLPLESTIIVTDTDEDSMDVVSNICDSIVHENVSPLVVAEGELSSNKNTFQDSLLEASAKMSLEVNVSDSKILTALGNTDFTESGTIAQSGGNDKNLAICEMRPTSACNVETIIDPISTKLAAIHHVSLAIKSLRWTRQLQSTESEMMDHGNQTHDKNTPPINLSVCACGDAECIEVCDIREWLPTSKLDHKLWKLVLLLGESYLVLGQAYKDDDQLRQALKVVELACSIYGSMPQHLKNSKFISSMICSSSSQEDYNNNSDYSVLSCDDDCLNFEQFSSTYLFWAKAWTLVGDVYVEFYIIRGKDTPNKTPEKSSSKDLRMSSEIKEEVKRLQKKLGRNKDNCSSCSLVNCSCQSDRASSGSSASSSNGYARPMRYSRKQNKKAHAKSFSHPACKDPEDDQIKKSSDTDKLEKKTSTSSNSERIEDTLEMLKMESKMNAPSENIPSETTKVKNGGIFKYLGDSVIGDPDYNLTTASSCYEEARKALGGFPCDSTELQSVIKKLGWVFNELGRHRLERKELDKAELAFAEAISAFEKVSDHTNIILINCNLGHGRRALAEEMLPKLEKLKKHEIFHDAFKKLLETVILKYSESLRYYGAAKSELNYIGEESCSVSSNLRNEVHTQFAHTYLRLGMLLAREGSVAKVCQNVGRAKKELRNHEISANDAIREALSMYESLGDLRKQEAAYAYFELARYQTDSCLKFLGSDHKERNLSNGETGGFQRVKQYYALAERNWQKTLDFYGPNTHPTMYLTIIMERAALSLNLSVSSRSNVLMDSALSCLLEGRHVSKDALNDNPEFFVKFRNQLQLLLKKMLAITLSSSTAKSCGVTQQSVPSNKKSDVEKLRELYKMSLRSMDLSQLHAMYNLWTS